MKYFTGNLLLLILSWLAVANSAEFHDRRRTQSTKAPTTRSTKAPTIKSTKAPTIKSTKATKAPTTKSTKAPTTPTAPTPTAPTPTAPTPTAPESEVPSEMPSEMPSETPTDLPCEDDPSFKYKREKGKDCDWVAEKPDQRCVKEWKGFPLDFYCPAACNAC